MAKITNRVRVYRNLHKGCYSIMEKTPKGWRVRGYANTVFLTNCRFIVNQTGRERVLRERKKMVHAFVEGDNVEPTSMADYVASQAKQAYYNPYHGPSFVLLSDDPHTDGSDVVNINHAKYCVLQTTTDGKSRIYIQEWK